MMRPGRMAAVHAWGAVPVLALTMMAAPRLVHASEPDAWITAKAKMALYGAAGVRAGDIDVDTVDARVTLHGLVDSDAERARAEEVVHGVDGVQAVRNLLQVRPRGARSAQAEVADDRLQREVQRALAGRPALGDVDVASVHGGVVLLSGRVPTLSDHLRAIEAVGHVPGVQRVASEIQSPDRLADDEIWRDDGAHGDASRGLGATARDAWVTSAVKMRLLADERTPGLDVNVDTVDGRVTLFGLVPTEDARAAAGEDAGGIAGVRDVENALQIVPATRQPAVKASDGDVERRVNDALAHRDDVSHDAIGVEVQNGVVRLTGTVPSNEARLRAAVTARAAPGVRAVRDDLQVESGR